MKCKLCLETLPSCNNAHTHAAWHCDTWIDLNSVSRTMYSNQIGYALTEIDGIHCYACEKQISKRWDDFASIYRHVRIFKRHGENVQRMTSPTLVQPLSLVTFNSLYSSGADIMSRIQSKSNTMKTLHGDCIGFNMDSIVCYFCNLTLVVSNQKLNAFRTIIEHITTVHEAAGRASQPRKNSELTHEASKSINYSFLVKNSIFFEDDSTFHCYLCSYKTTDVLDVFNHVKGHNQLQKEPAPGNFLVNFRKRL